MNFAAWLKTLAAAAIGGALGGAAQSVAPTLAGGTPVAPAQIGYAAAAGAILTAAALALRSPWLQPQYPQVNATGQEAGQVQPTTTNPPAK